MAKVMLSMEYRWFSHVARFVWQYGECVFRRLEVSVGAAALIHIEVIEHRLSILKNKEESRGRGN